MGGCWTKNKPNKYILIITSGSANYNWHCLKILKPTKQELNFS